MQPLRGESLSDRHRRYGKKCLHPGRDSNEADILAKQFQSLTQPHPQTLRPPHRKPQHR